MKRFLKFFLLGLFVILTNYHLTNAQDIRIPYIGNTVNIASKTSAQPMTSAAGQTYIISVLPNQAVSFYITNSGGTISMSEQIFTTGNSFAPDYTNNKMFWHAVQTLLNGTGLSAGGASQTMSLTANSTNVITIPMTQATQVAINLFSASSASGTLTINAVVTPNGAVPINSVQGAQPTGANVTTENPVLIAGSIGTNIGIPALCGNPAGWCWGLAATPNTFGFSQGGTAFLGGQLPLYTLPVYLTSSVLQGGTTVSSNAFEEVDQAHSVAATAAGNTQIWAGLAAHAVRIECVSVDVTANATLAAAGIETIKLFYGTSGASGLQWDVFLPTSGTSNAYHDSICWQGGAVVDPSLSNALNVNLSTALATGEVFVRVTGAQF